MFFILLIGMISFTALGTTTHLEQKQNTTVDKEYTIPMAVANVAFVKQFTPLDNYGDVGPFYKTNSILIDHYKEKLNKKSNCDKNDCVYICRSNC